MRKIYVDGAYKDGFVGIGVYLGNGLNIDDEFSAKIKARTSVEAELRAIEFGLMRAIKLGMKDVEIFNDCEEAVNRYNEGRLSGYFSFDHLNKKFDVVKVKKIHRDFNIGHAYSREGLEREISKGCDKCHKWIVHLFSHCADCGCKL